MTSDYRRKIKKACSAGIQVDAHPDPSATCATTLFPTCARFAAERRLQAPDGRNVDAMYTAGDAILFVARKKAAFRIIFTSAPQNRLGTTCTV
jgi:hypothetical protein